jgi:hypothetical protein
MRPAGVAYCLAPRNAGKELRLRAIGRYHDQPTRGRLALRGAALRDVAAARGRPEHPVCGSGHIADSMIAEPLRLARPLGTNQFGV